MQFTNLEEVEEAARLVLPKQVGSWICILTSCPSILQVHTLKERDVLCYFVYFQHICRPLLVHGPLFGGLPTCSFISAFVSFSLRLLSSLTCRNLLLRGLHTESDWNWMDAGTGLRLSDEGDMNGDKYRICGFRRGN